MLNHVEQNRDTFLFWIRRNERLQASADIFKPIIPEFVKDNPGVNLNGCQDCVIDMLRWAIKKLKESKGEPTAEEKMKGIKKNKDADSKSPNNV